MKIQFEALTPILWTNQLQESIDFYIQILGFTLSNKQNTWAFLKKEKIEIMLSLPPKPNSIAFSGSFYFRVNDIEALWVNLKDKTSVYYELETFPWEMREFAITDPNGYIIQFGQSV